MLGNALMVVSFFLSISGCYNQDINFSIRFGQIEGLRAQDRIIFEENRIGQVESISYTNEGDYLVHVQIDKPFLNAATEYSRFFIIDDPSKRGRKAVQMVRTGKGGLPLEKGAVVEGTTRFAFLLSTMQDNLGKAVSDLNRKFKEMSDDLKGIPESSEVKEFERYLGELKEKMLSAGAGVREKIQKDLLPWLQKEIDKLRERLRKLGREKEVEPLEVKMEELRRI
ncbi:MAG: hypothetical protein JRF51_10265 [Deltaproteobacteria bacterium]|nr:hypothetical protein [Deltaproteobacteria bacterium]